MQSGRSTGSFLVSVCVLIGSSGSPLPADAQQSPQPSILYHHLEAEIRPHSHELLASDQITVRVDPGLTAITFSLATTLEVDRIDTVQSCEPSCTTAESVSFQTEISRAEFPSQLVTVLLSPRPAKQNTVVLRWYYRGRINDPPREPRHLRFVTPSQTSGHIGPEGVYLSSESLWYPDLARSLATFEVAVRLPNGWSAVTQGREGEMAGQWIVDTKAEALTVVANRFVVNKRDWRARNGQTVMLATYLFPDDAALADEYLGAAAKYIDAYIPILGSYPFEKFAVVENFFASGLGMPSFTLLGSSIIKRHYTQPYALGHEIVHSWIGNSVFNAVDEGNWVEGLTTYLANYYWHELAPNLEEARSQRRLMVFGYSVYVRLDQDYPVAEFRRKTDERDNAIGYQKLAMVFHMLRREIGDKPFFNAIRNLVAARQSAYAGWRDLLFFFHEASGRDLSWFFEQWVTNAGAPEFEVVGGHLRMGGSQPGSTETQTLSLHLRQIQVGPLYRLRLPVTIELEDGRTHQAVVDVRTKDQEWLIPLPGRPVRFSVDPDMEIFRRIRREELPAMLNLYVTDQERTILAAGVDTDEVFGPVETILKRVEGQEAGKPLQVRTSIQPVPKDGLLPSKGSVLILAGPEQHTQVQSIISQHCGHRASVDATGFTIAGRSSVGGEMAVLFTCHRVDEPTSGITVFYAMTPEAGNRVARLLFFYGWHSYVVFKNGQAIDRGEWQAGHGSQEIRLDG